MAYKWGTQANINLDFINIMNNEIGWLSRYGYQILFFSIFNLDEIKLINSYGSLIYGFL